MYFYQTKHHMNMKGQKAEILIIFQQQLFAEGLALMLRRNKDYHVRLFALNPQTVLQDIQKLPADFLIFELSYITKPLIEIFRQIRLVPELKNILLVTGMIPQHYFEELRYIVNGFLSRFAQMNDLFIALQQIQAEGKFFSTQLVNVILSNQPHLEATKLLTIREKEILQFWFLMDIHHIAHELSISEATVRTHLKNIRQKLGRPSLMRLMFHACQESQLNGHSNSFCSYCKSLCSADTTQWLKCHTS